MTITATNENDRDTWAAEEVAARLAGLNQGATSILWTPHGMVRVRCLVEGKLWEFTPMRDGASWRWVMVGGRPVEGGTLWHASLADGETKPYAFPETPFGAHSALWDALDYLRSHSPAAVAEVA